MRWRLLDIVPDYLFLGVPNPNYSVYANEPRYLSWITHSTPRSKFSFPISSCLYKKLAHIPIDKARTSIPTAKSNVRVDWIKELP